MTPATAWTAPDRVRARSVGDPAPSRGSTPFLGGGGRGGAGPERAVPAPDVCRDKLAADFSRYLISHSLVTGVWTAVPLTGEHAGRTITADDDDGLRDAIQAFQAQCREWGCHAWT